MTLSLTSPQIEAIKSLSIPVGHTSRFNHDACPAGVDTRRRMYATKKPDGAYLCYCHNCGQGNIVGGSGPRIRSAVVTAPATGSLYTPPVGIPLTDLGKLWLTAWGIIAPANVMSTPDDDGIIIPFADGHQIRWFYKDGLKWQTFGDCEFNVMGENVVICEDILSAVKFIDADPDNGAICVFGSSAAGIMPMMPIPPERMYMVWFDNDNDQVNKNAELAARKFASVSSNVVLCTGGTDPKRYTAKELIDVRDQARKLCGTAAPTDKP